MKNPQVDKPEVLEVRSTIVWMWYFGWRVRDISYATGLSYTTIYRWIKSWMSREKFRHMYFIIWIIGTLLCESDADQNSPGCMNLNQNEVTSLLPASIWSSEKNGWSTTPCREMLQKIVPHLMSLSPPHATDILYDEYFKETSSLLASYSRTVTATSIVEYSPNIAPFLKALSSLMMLTTTLRRHVIVACSPQNVIELFTVVSRENMENHMVWWLVIVEDSSVMSHLQRILREGSQVIVISISKENVAELFMSGVDLEGNIRFQKVGSLKNEENDLGGSALSIPGFIDIDQLYADFEGRRIITSAIDDHPFITMSREEGDEEGPFILEGGFEGLIVMALSESLNFTSSMMTPADGKWGGPIANGSVVGMIGDVFRREAHFALTEITITGSREEVIDFSYPHYIETLTLISRTPREKSRAFGALSPFTPQVWACILLSIIVISPVLVIQKKLTDDFNTETVDGFTMGNIILNITASLLKQANLLSANHWALKSTFLYWYIFSLFISALYSGMLIASLVKPSFEKPINSLVDLPGAVKEGFTVVVTKDTTHEYLFKNAKDGIYAATWKLFNHEDPSKSFTEDSYDDILKEKIVIIWGQTGAQYRSLRKGMHHYHFARDAFSPQFYGIAFFAGASFQSKFNQMLSYMAEGGLINKWRDDEFRKVSVDSIVDVKTGPKAFSLNHVLAAFILLAIGHLTAAVVMVSELIVASLIFKP